MLEEANPAYPLSTSEAQIAFLGALHSRQSLMAGFTTVRSVGNYRAFVDVALRDAINNGWIIGPRMLVAGAYLTTSRGGGEMTGAARDVTLPADMRVGVADTPDEVRMRVREILAGGADFIKMIATGAVLTGGTNPGVPAAGQFLRDAAGQLRRRRASRCARVRHRRIRAEPVRADEQLRTL